MPDSALVIGVGASAGLGAALARRFAREGLHVVVAGRTRAKVEAVASEIRAQGGSAEALACDATRGDDVVRAFERAVAAGPLVLAVYNAGNNHIRPLLEMDDAFFEDVWRVCCFGGFLAGREAARRMLPPEADAATGGRTLLFTGATASIRARPPFTAFASAKAALRALAQGIAREFGPRGLHVAHVIIDGGIDGEQLNARFPQMKQSKGAEGMLQPDAIAEVYWQIHRQHPSTWSFELDLRPFKEAF